MLTQSQKEDVIRFVRSLKTPSFTFRDVIRHLDLESEDRRSLQRYLDELDSQGIIHRVKRGRYALPSREMLVSGALSCHRDGYGFVTPDDQATYKQDIFVPARNMEGALHGDRVLIRVTRKSKPSSRRLRRRPTEGERAERLEGTVVHVLERTFPNVVGRYYEHPRYPFVAPLDARVLHDIHIPFHASKGAKSGQIVAVAITVAPSKYQSPQGNILEILGYPGDPGIEYQIVAHKFGLPTEFSPETRREAEQIPDHILEEECLGREDFRCQLAVTIDGENARDFDDAVSLKGLESSNYLLGIHIADVSHYVRDGSAMDRDAYQRGTSVYFPDKAIPMLPHRLSSGICSLKPGEDRLVFSVLMEVDPHGNVIKHRFSQGILRSRERMTYTDVARILVERNPQTRERYAELVPMFEAMQELCLILSNKRRRRGAVDFDLPEADIQFDQEGKIIGVAQAERNIAHDIIEEFMLLANETVAQKLAASEGPALYRVHEKPDPQKVNDFAEFALALGYRLDSHRGQVRPRDFQKFVEQLEGKIEARFLAYLMLRSFMQARYSERNLGHFGLATAEYTHFTSPIRRYPDLVVHRLLKEALQEELSSAWRARMSELLPTIAMHTSSRERIADEAEREIEKVKKVQFMADKVGDEFDGIVFSVTRQGFFVELLDPFVEGFVPAATLVDDAYSYKERTHSFVGERRRKHYKLGSRILVRLDSTDLETHRLFFSVV